jgi:hypothetical protein
MEAVPAVEYECRPVRNADDDWYCPTKNVVPATNIKGRSGRSILATFCLSTD